MDDRYARTMEQAERVLQNIAVRAERSLNNLAARTPEARAAAKRERQRRSREVARRAKRILLAVAAIIAAHIAWSLAIAPIGAGGAMIMFAMLLAAVVLLAIYPKSRKTAVVDQLSNAEVVHRLDAMLIRERPALPPPALSAVDAISAQLPLLERRLETLDPLDPLAQDARRLMGRHLPDLIMRYEKVPPTHRRQRDGEGMTVEDRLLGGLGAAKKAIDDISDRLVEGDLSAFQTQGRFIESRYKDGEVG